MEIRTKVPGMWPGDVEGVRIEREVRAQSGGAVGGMSDWPEQWSAAASFDG